MNLDFKNTNISYSSHGFHTYPAKMIPQVAKALIREFGKKDDVLFDPYCGSGTSLVEANLNNIHAIGTDLNPLARLITEVKTRPIEIQSLDLHLKDFYNYLFQYRFGIDTQSRNIIKPKFKNIDFWFSRLVTKDLAILKAYIEEIENISIKKFFQVAFSQTIRECSWTRKNEFKLYKMSPERIKTFKPDTFATFEKILGKNRNGLEDFMNNSSKTYGSTVLDFNTIHKIPKRIIKEQSIDLVVTSPPYGDSATTVAYGQFSTLANQWLGFLENGRLLDKHLMGGIPSAKLLKLKSNILNDQLQVINNVDRKRALEVASFYSDYYKSIRNISTCIKPKGFACYVVSNRNVRGTRLQTDLITSDFFKANGFTHIETFERNISSKRLPKKNSSIGKEGHKTTLMNKEYIVIMQKN